MEQMRQRMTTRSGPRQSVQLGSDGSFVLFCEAIKDDLRHRLSPRDETAAKTHVSRRCQGPAHRTLGRFKHQRDRLDMQPPRGQGR